MGTVPNKAIPLDADGGSPALGDVLEFMRHLWGVDHGLQSTSKRMESELGVTGPQRLVIRIVGQRPGIAAGELADVLHVHPSTLTGVLGRLERRGFLVRKTDPADKRRSLIALTIKGSKLDRVRSGTVEAKVKTTLGRLPRQKIRAAQDVLAALAEALRET
jgi:MarR family transcriptional regulator, organic hydroperoxide resistance regulator